MYSWQKIITKGIIIGLSYFMFNSISMAAPSTEGIQVYQKNVHLSPERKQSLADDIDRYYNAGNIWGSLRENFTLPHYEDSERVQEQINWYMNNQDFLYHSASRAAPYLYYILQQIKKRHLPGEFALLPIIESSFNPFSYSSAGAAGLWQLMPATANDLGVKQNSWYDGRRDVVASTKAALNHLSYLNDFFNGNWLYAIAAYNTGEGNVLSAIKKNIRIGDSTDFWSLPVAQQTRDYIPKILALATIISHPEQYPIELPYVRNAPYLAEVDIGSRMDLKHAAFLAGLSLKELKQLNPGFNSTTIGPNGPFKLILPIENVEQFSENLASSPQFQEQTPELSKTILASAQQDDFSASTRDSAKKVKRKLQLLASSKKTKAEVIDSHYTLQPGDTLYMVRDGDNIQKIADRFHTSTSNIKLANNINSYTTLQTGMKLVIPTHAITSTEPTVEPKKYQMSPGDTLYMVRRGDTMEKIAKKYHTTPASIRLANLVSDDDVKEGIELIIPTHV